MSARRKILTVTPAKVAIAGLLVRFTRQYSSQVPPSAQNGLHQAEWIAERLVPGLRKDGWERVSEAGARYNVLIEHGVQIPQHHVIPCSSAVHAQEVAARSSAGAYAVWRCVGPWRTGDHEQL